jgi:hypothetical protein
LLRLIEHQKNVDEKNNVKFVKLSSSSVIENAKIAPFSSSCSKFESIKVLDEFIRDTDVFVTNVYNT